MKMRSGDASSLWSALNESGTRADRFLWGVTAAARLGDLDRGSSLGGRRDTLRDRSVLLAIEDQLAAALALIELDGLARRLILCPPGLPPEHMAAIMGTAEVDAIVSDRDWRSGISGRLAPILTASGQIAPAVVERGADRLTEWILLTSGTTGVPKLVVHDFATLAGPIRSSGDLGQQPVWGTFYDIRRYGGLQIFFRALLGGGSMVLSSTRESTGDFLARAGGHGITHISGTPSHWRRALMSSWAGRIAPCYVRLSGEIADQTILDQLRAAYPGAGIAHAFASTEAGVGFEVNDGRAGFPAELIGRTGVSVELRVIDGSLRIRSSRTGLRYLGKGAALAGADGFVDTGDMVERRGERYYFVGRRDGVINVGGQKVHPEEVEVVINAHPAVRMSLVKARRNPIIGAVVVAEVVLGEGFEMRAADCERQILAACREVLAPHKVPAVIRIVSALGVNSTGKLSRDPCPPSS